jgi:hypothetical protein
MGRVRIGLIALVLAASTSVVDARPSGSAVPGEARLWHDADTRRTDPPKSQVLNAARREFDAVFIRNIRFKAAPPVNGSPAARVTFEIHNESQHSLADIVLAVSLVEPRSRNDPKAERAIVAGPLTIQSKAVLLPGYSFDYDVTLRNISSDCRCVPAVRVVQARLDFR